MCECDIMTNVTDLCACDTLTCVRVKEPLTNCGALTPGAKHNMLICVSVTLGLMSCLSVTLSLMSLTCVRVTLHNILKLNQAAT